VNSRHQALAWERRWATPVAIATLLAVVGFVVSGAVGSKISGEGQAALLRSAHEHSSSVTLSGAVDALAFLLLALPLGYLFRVVEARGEGMRSGMIALVVAAPLFLALSTGLGIVAKHDAANAFTAGEAKSTLSSKEASKECAATLKDKGAKSFADEYPPQGSETPRAACERREVEDDEASNAVSEASLTGLATFFGIAGGLSLIVGLFYTSLWAMRTGVLSRFWAALGMALGVTVLLGVVLFLLFWLIYVGLLIGGWVPRGRPPAWAAGEAIPWPSPGEKAAETLESEEQAEDPPELEDPDGATETARRPPASDESESHS
jgi:Na+-transporting methylmalonyl-CoA/oxaloacetate decarboxylase gamma subunit